MMRTFGLFFAFLFLLPSLAFPSDRECPSQAILDEVTSRGRFLSEYDSAVWTATDVLEASSPVRERAMVYIATKSGTTWTVSFGALNDTSGTFLVGYEAYQQADLKHFSLRTFDPPQPVRDFRLPAARALMLGVGTFGKQDRPYNVALIPIENGQFLVYLYPAVGEKWVWPCGGDIRYKVSKDGRTILETQRLHNGIMEETYNSEVVAVTHSMVLTPFPTETDVVNVLKRIPKIPEYAGSADLIFRIEVDGTIRCLGQRAEKAQEGDTSESRALRTPNGL